MADEGLLPANARDRNALRPVPPLASFWHRLGAVLVDLLLVYMLLRLTFPLLRPFYLQVGAWSVLLTLALVYVYLFLAEGPVGKGRTVGKAVLGIQTTDANGAPLRPTAAAVRAGVMLPYMLPLLSGELSGPFIGADPTRFYLAQLATHGVGSACIIANVFLAAMHPLRQTVPDLAAGSLVLREAGAHQLAAFQEQVAEQAAPLDRRAKQVAFLAFVALTGVSAFFQYRTLFNPDARRQFRFMEEFRKEFRFQDMTPVFMPGRMLDLQFLLQREGHTTESITALLKKAGAADQPSTDTHLVMVVFRSRSAIEPEDLGPPERMQELTRAVAAWAARSIRENAFPLNRESRVRRAGPERAGGKPFVFQPRHVALLFVEEINLLLYPFTLMPPGFHSDIRIVHAEIAPLELSESFYETESQEAAGESAPVPAALEPLTTAPLEAGATTGPVERGAPYR